MKMRKLVSVLVVLAMLIGVLSASQMSVGALTSGVYEYEMYTNDSVIITGYTGGAKEKLTIPSTLGGYPVKAIGEEAFISADIYAVVLPDSLESVGDFAFWNTAVSTVSIPKNVTHVGAGAFSGGLFESFSVDSKNSHFSVSDGVLFNKDKSELVAFPTAKESKSYTVPSSVKIIKEYAFCSALYMTEVTLHSKIEQIYDGAFMFTSLRSVTIPASCLWVGHYAFADCAYLLTVSVKSSDTLLSPYAFDESRWYTDQPRGVVYIGTTAYLYKGDAPEEVTIKAGTVRINGKAFAEQEDLQKVNIPASVTEIDLSAFDQCYSLSDIEVAQSNSEFASVDGMLYSKDKTQLLVCPAGKSGVVTVIEGTEHIEWYAFEYCEKITEVILPDTLEILGEGAFYGCKSLQKVVVPDSVKTVAGGTFMDCTSLSDVSIPEGTTKFFYVDFLGTKWLEEQSDGVLYLCKNALGYKSDATAVEKISFAEGTLAIGNLSFFGFNVSSVEFPDSLKAIGEGAFANCLKLKDVEIPASVDEIGEYALGYEYWYDEETQEETFIPIEGFVIRGYNGTAAEAYAQKHGFEFVSLGEIPVSKLIGDVDGDGKISVRDATAIQKHLADILLLTQEQKNVADFNKDGTVNVRDATSIQKFLAGLEY